MNNKVGLDDTGLFNQAIGPVAKDLLHSAVRAIDEQFGQGFAAKNPALVASLIETMHKDYSVASMLRRAEQLTETVERIADAIESLAPRN